MDLIWAPHVLENLKDSELVLYLDFSCSACIPSGACNVDRALQVLYQSNGDIKLALEKLLNRTDAQQQQYHDHAIWTEDERQCFERLIKFHGKNFSQISLSMKTKSTKECVEFYYLWKKSTNSPRPVGVMRATATPISPTRDHNNNNSDSNNNEEGGTNNATTSSIHHQTTNIKGEMNPDELLPDVEQFPCKVCGRVFLKIKSRSAHMKRHKNER